MRIRKAQQKTQDIEDIFGIIDRAKVEEVKQQMTQYQSVEDVLRKYKGFVKVLYSGKSLQKFFDRCYKNGIVAVDTETDNSLDPRTAKLVGMCLYTLYHRPVYVPVLHRDPLTNELVQGQASLCEISDFCEKLNSLGIKCIFHNAKFDINVIDTNCHVRLKPYWDTMVVAKLLDENRKSCKLKELFRDYIEPAQPVYGIKNFFERNETADIEKFALYSAMDSYETYKLYLSQEKILQAQSMQKLRNLVTMEMRICEITAVMEQEGANLDIELCKKYREFFKKRAGKAQEKINTFQI